MSELIIRINTLLSPIENILKAHKKYIGYFFLILAVLSFGFFWADNGVKESGEKAIFVLWVILWIPIFARVFGIRIFQAIMSLRQELGILMGTLAFVHGAMYIVPYPTMIGESYFWLDDTTVLSYLAFGFFALLLTIPLTLTSTKWAMRVMWRYWKMLHRMVYVIIIFTVIHVVLIQWAKHMEWGPVIILVLYFGLKVLEWRGFSFAGKNTKKIYPKWQKWLCIPCGYIYDPLLWDEADGIAPGTEFSDIPDDWRCPDCGVTKADFVPFEDDGTKTPPWHEAKIVEKTYLNPVTLKLVIELTEDLKSIAGQFVTFMWSDAEWEFSRSYSIAEHTGKQLTFLIKLTDLGRWARLLRDISSDATIRIRGIFGRFVLQDTQSPKVFLATGTWLAPIYNMIRALPEWVNKSLYFTVATCTELFYVDELKSIQGLDLHIHTTKEQTPDCNYGRVDVDNIIATPDTEWYLCGSPRMVEEATTKLQARGYEKIYSEEFN